jgi:hypothetical protein
MLPSIATEALVKSPIFRHRTTNCEQTLRMAADIAGGASRAADRLWIEVCLCIKGRQCKWFLPRERTAMIRA